MRCGDGLCRSYESVPGVVVTGRERFAKVRWLAQCESGLRRWTRHFSGGWRWSGHRRDAHVLRRQPVPLTLLDDVPVMASQARRSPLCGQRGRRRLRGQLGRQRILLVDGRVSAVRAVVVGGSAAAGCAAGITTLTLLTWIVFAVAAWEGRGDGAVLGRRRRGLLRADGEDWAPGGTCEAALGGPEMRTYLAGQLVGQRGPGTHRAVELGRCPQYHLGGYTQLARQPVHIDHVCCSFSKRCRLNRY